ncbi:PRK06851 family protein [Bacillus sp. B15-48]|uniref:PRK06851 family protein n=1 Tax=Bacillus sp. B15-48 TaxID=1548601 RepID=UPI00193F7D33|nr:PRK06851 family protein [Bacillus sp. B15-48]MBM4761622.1 hypothetical protein [Bacillus sp. B15-48]
MGKVLNYFAGGNTARGFYSLYESNLQGLSRVFILKGGPGTGKSTLMKKIGKEWNDKGYDVEYLHCSSDHESIDGVIFRSLGVGIVDGTAPHVIEPTLPGVVEEYVNLGVAWNSDQLQAQKEEIELLSTDRSAAFKAAYETFAEALRVHDEWEKIYIENMDFNKANELTEDLLARLFEGKNLEKQADVYHRYLGAATPVGAVDFVPNITEGLSKRYFIKGRPGSGKSTMLKKIAAEAEVRGFDTEVYHCGFDPHSLDMIIVRELGFAIFDSTAPHEYFPEKETDEIVDMYGTIIAQGTDEKYDAEIQDCSSRYRANMNKAIASLAKAKSLHEELEAIYKGAMDYRKIDELTVALNKEIEKLAVK